MSVMKFSGLNVPMPVRVLCLKMISVLGICVGLNLSGGMTNIGGEIFWGVGSTAFGGSGGTRGGFVVKMTGFTGAGAIGDFSGKT